LSSSYLCLKESDWRKGILASDSTGVETDRYDYEIRFVKSKRKFEKILVKQYLKWHVTAILDHLIILSTRLTSKKTHDSPVLQTMVNRLKKYGVDLAGSIFNADKGYDGERNFESLFGIHVLPNIKQRTNALLQLGGPASDSFSIAALSSSSVYNTAYLISTGVHNVHLLSNP
jgi:hypothetical protein